MEDFTINCRELLIKLFNKYRNGEKIQRMLFTSDIEYKEVIKGREHQYLIRECDVDKFIEFYNLPRDEKWKISIIKLYGSIENYKKVSNESRNKTNLEKYGVEHYFQSNDCKEKIKQTNLEKYGVESYFQTEECKLRSKQTCLEKYGTEYAIQNENVKNKIKETNLKKYGVSCVLRKDGVQEKVQQTNLEKYGCKFPLQNKEIHDETINTQFEKYGGYYISNLSEEDKQKYDDKRKQTCIERYGVEHISKVPKFIEKSLNSRFLHYNTYTVHHNYEYDGLKFHSSWEVYYYIYQKEILKNDIIKGDIFEYEFENKICKYECDFKVNGENVEIKGNQYLNENGELYFPYIKQDKIDYVEKQKQWNAKQDCMIKNNVNIVSKEEMDSIISEVDLKFPNIIESCKIKNFKNPYLRLCFDPRDAKNKIKKSKIVTYQNLYEWCYKHLDLLNGKKPYDFVSLCFIKNKNGAYIYNAEEAFNILKNINEDIFPKIKAYDRIDTRKYPMILCSDTNEIKSSRDWSRLGYDKVKLVAEGKRKFDKGLHFEFIKDENGNYVCDEETALKIINNHNIDTINS